MPPIAGTYSDCASFVVAVPSRRALPRGGGAASGCRSQRWEGEGGGGYSFAALMLPVPVLLAGAARRAPGDAPDDAAVSTGAGPWVAPAILEGAEEDPDRAADKEPEAGGSGGGASSPSAAAAPGAARRARLASAGVAAGIGALVALQGLTLIYSSRLMFAYLVQLVFLLTPLVTAVANRYLLRQRTPRALWPALAAALAGSALVIVGNWQAHGQHGDNQDADGGGSSARDLAGGFALAVASMLLLAAYLVLLQVTQHMVTGVQVGRWGRGGGGGQGGQGGGWSGAVASVRGCWRRGDAGYGHKHTSLATRAGHVGQHVRWPGAADAAGARRRRHRLELGGGAQRRRLGRAGVCRVLYRRSQHDLVSACCVSRVQHWHPRCVRGKGRVQLVVAHTHAAAWTRVRRRRFRGAMPVHSAAALFAAPARPACNPTPRHLPPLAQPTPRTQHCSRVLGAAVVSLFICCRLASSVAGSVVLLHEAPKSPLTFAGFALVAVALTSFMVLKMFDRPEGGAEAGAEAEAAAEAEAETPEAGAGAGDDKDREAAGGAGGGDAGEGAPHRAVKVAQALSDDSAYLSDTTAAAAGGDAAAAAAADAAERGEAPSSCAGHGPQ